MLNFYRWYPTAKIVFLAPTKPLVTQQLEAVISTCGIREDECSLLLGTVQANKRIDLWNSKRVMFATPQTILSDINRASCPTKSIVCLVIDEAHRATGNHSYVQVVKNVMDATNGQCRILALSATPGSDMNATKALVRVLKIGRLACGRVHLFCV